MSDWTPDCDPHSSGLCVDVSTDSQIIEGGADCNAGESQYQKNPVENDNKFSEQGHLSSDQMGKLDELHSLSTNSIPTETVDRETESGMQSQDTNSDYHQADEPTQFMTPDGEILDQELGRREIIRLSLVRLSEFDQDWFEITQELETNQTIDESTPESIWGRLEKRFDTMDSLLSDQEYAEIFTEVVEILAEDPCDGAGTMLRHELKRREEKLNVTLRELDLSNMIGQSADLDLPRPRSETYGDEVTSTIVTSRRRAKSAVSFCIISESETDGESEPGPLPSMLEAPDDVPYSDWLSALDSRYRLLVQGENDDSELSTSARDLSMSERPRAIQQLLQYPSYAEVFELAAELATTQEDIERNAALLKEHRDELELLEGELLTQRRPSRSVDRSGQPQEIQLLGATPLYDNAEEFIEGTIDGEPTKIPSPVVEPLNIWGEDEMLAVVGVVSTTGSVSVSMSDVILSESDGPETIVQPLALVKEIIDDTYVGVLTTLHDEKQVETIVTVSGLEVIDEVVSDVFIGLVEAGEPEEVFPELTREALAELDGPTRTLLEALRDAEPSGNAMRIMHCEKQLEEREEVVKMLWNILPEFREIFNEAQQSNENNADDKQLQEFRIKLAAIETEQGTVARLAQQPEIFSLIDLKFGVAYNEGDDETLQSRQELIQELLKNPEYLGAFNACEELVSQPEELLEAFMEEIQEQRNTMALLERRETFQPTPDKLPYLFAELNEEYRNRKKAVDTVEDPEAQEKLDALHNVCEWLLKNPVYRDVFAEAADALSEGSSDIQDFVEKLREIQDEICALSPDTLRDATISSLSPNYYKLHDPRLKAEYVAELNRVCANIPGCAFLRENVEVEATECLRSIPPLAVPDYSSLFLETRKAGDNPITALSNPSCRRLCNSPLALHPDLTSLTSENELEATRETRVDRRRKRNFVIDE